MATWKLITVIVIATLLAELLSKNLGISNGCGCGRQ